MTEGMGRERALAAALAPRAARRRLAILAKWGVCAAALGYLVASGGLRPEHLRIAPAGRSWLIAAVALLVGGMLAAPLRYWILLRALDVRLPLGMVMRISLIGNFFGVFGLGGLGGDVARVAYVVRSGASRSAALASTAVDRVVGLLSVFLLGGVALALSLPSVLATPSLLQPALAVCGVLLFLPSCLLALVSCQPGGMLAGVLARRVPGGARIVEALRPLTLYGRRPAALAAALLLSLALQAVSVLSIFAVSRAVAPPEKPTLAQCFFATPVAFAANTLPLPGGGLGAGEAAFEQLLRYCRTDEGEPVVGGAAIFLAWRFWAVATSLIGLPLYLRGGELRFQPGLEA